MSESTADLRVTRLIRELAREAYGGPASPDVYLCECGHGQPEHEGEEWEGRCTVEGCPCVEYRDAA